MADWMDPYAAQATNPYLQMPQQQEVSPWMALANLATGIGTGISQGSASGRGWASGLAPGIMMGNQLTGQQRQQAEQQALKRWQLGMMAQEYAGKQQDRELKRKAQEEDAKSYLPPGMRAPSAPLLGPGSYDTKVAALEGGAKNGGMVYNELGSGAFGPYQFMPSTWASVVQQNPNLGLPADIKQATREQHDQAHGAFKASNAQALQAAGFQPTPDNLYLAHRFGVGGALSVLRANPEQSLAEVLPADWQRQNPDMRGQTAGGFRRLAAERVGGGGSVPYEVSPNAKPTQYAMMPDQLPGFEMPDGVSSLLPRGNQPQTWTAPVMPQPQPQATMTPAQYTPPQQQQPAPVPEGPPKLVLPPKPELPEADALRIYKRRQAGAITAAEARAEADRITGDLWSTQKAEAQAKYQQESENYRFNRGQEAGEWQILDPKNAQMKLGPGYDNGKAYLINKKGEIKPVGGALVEVNTGDKLMPGQKKVDEKFADQYIEFVSGGGFADSTKMLNQLQEVQTALKSGAKLTGPVIGTMGDTLLSFANPDAMAMRDAVFEVAQRNLRLVLGAQFTAKEGEQLIARTYNPRLSEEENSKRVGRLMEQIKTAMEARVDSAKYFEEHGTLRGWRGKLPSMADFEPAKTPEQAPPPAAAPPPGAIKHLQMNPKLRDEFDAKYGPGAAAKALGK